MITNSDIVNVIRHTRNSEKLTQTEFGNLLEASKQTICSWEKGRNLPDVLKFMRILELSGVDIAALLHSEHKPTSEGKINEQLTLQELILITKLRSLTDSQLHAVEAFMKVV